MRQMKRPLLISFSGIDGAGKSTQISMLQACLAAAGLRFSVLTFWDDVAVLSGLREFSSHAVFHGDKGVGSPERPIIRRDKNVQSWPMAMLRLFLYVLDAIHLGIVVAKSKRHTADVVIFDRYIYDEMANLPLRRWYARAYVRFLLKLAPEPDVAYVLDADAQEAWRRKREYPLEFVERNRAAYLLLSSIAKGITVVAPGAIGEAQWKIVEELVKKLPDRQREFFTSAKTLIDA
jgi:thymidylate kinase